MAGHIGGRTIERDLTVPRAVGLVGAGFIGRMHVAAIAKLALANGIPMPTLLIADVNGRASRSLINAWPVEAVEASVDDMLEEPSLGIVLLCTPNVEHQSIASAVLRSAKGLVCEKPLASSLDGAAVIADAASASDAQAAMAFVFRTWPVVEAAHDLVASGEIGEPFSLNAQMYHGYGLDPTRPLGWRSDVLIAGAGAVIDVGSHIIDVARYLMGEVSGVSAHLHTLVPVRSGMGENERSSVDDSASMLLSFESGAAGSVRASWAAAGYGTDVGFEVLGTHGSLRFSWRHRDELQVSRVGRGRQTLLFDGTAAHDPGFWPVAGLGVGYDDAFVAFYRKFFSHQAASGGVASIADGHACQVVVDAAIRSSSRRGEYIDLQRQPVGVLPSREDAGEAAK